MMVTEHQLWVLIAVFLAASIVSVITGSTSLITVPIMLQVGIDPQVALATNMLALTLMSLGGALPFVGKGIFDRPRLPLLIGLTLAASILGAGLVLIVPSRSLPTIISISMILVAVLSAANRNQGIEPPGEIPSRTAAAIGYVLTFLLGIYGGFFSGGYVTLLTAVFVMFFRMTFLQAIATTKLINLFSSLAATLIFIGQGLIDYKLGLILGLTMFVGGTIGGRLSLSLSNVWLQRIYLGVVGVLALLTLKRSLQSEHSR